MRRRSSLRALRSPANHCHAWGRRPGALWSTLAAALLLLEPLTTLMLMLAVADGRRWVEAGNGADAAAKV